MPQSEETPPAHNHDDPWASGTGIPQLDELLGGELRGFVSIDRGKPIYNSPSLLIIGDPGCGKTTISLHFALETIRKGRSVIFFSLEETDDDIRAKVEHLLSLQKLLSRVFIVSMPQDVDLAQLLPRESEPSPLPVLIISYYPDALIRGFFNRQHLPAHLNSVLHSLKILADSRRIQPLGAIILDPLSPEIAPRSFFGRRDPYKDRAMFKGICELGSKANAITLLVVERTAGIDWREFVADIVLEITWDRTDRSGWQRRLRIVKARHVASWDGSHTLRFDPDGRLLLFPANSELSRHLREISDSTPIDADAVHSFSCSNAINAFLSKEDGRVPRGSTVLVYGEDETRKNLIAIRFLQAVVSDGDDAECLMIACGSTKAVARSLAEHYADRHSSHADFLARRLHVEVGPVTGESPDEFVGRIYDLLKGRSFTRALVDDQAALHQLALVSHLLREMFIAKNITSLFVRTVDENVHDTEREFYDTVIRSKHVVLPGGKRAIAYWLLKFKGRAGENGRWFEFLVRSPSSEIEFQDSFRNLREINGHLSHEPFVLRLHASDTRVQRYWNEFIGTGFSHFFVDQSQSALKLFFFDDSGFDLVFRSLMHWPQDVEVDVTQIVSIDEFWAEGLGCRGILTPILDAFSSNELELLLRRYPDFVRRNIPRHPETDKVLLLPHHLDFGLYAARKDTIAKAIDVIRSSGDSSALERVEGIAAALLSGDGVYSWGDVAFLARELSKAGSEICVLDFRSNGTPESIVCFMLEVLWPYIFDWSEDDQKWTYAGFSNPIAVLAATEFCILLNDISPFLWKGKAEKEDHREAILQRHWLASMSGYQRASKRCSENLFIVNAPFLEGAGFCSHRAVSIRGDWYLGVVKGRLGAHWVEPILSGMLSEDAAWRLSLVSGGLPPFESLIFDKRFTRPNGHQFADMYKVTATRKDIPRYSEERTYITSKVYELFELLGSERWGKSRDDIEPVVGVVLELIGQRLEVSRPATRIADAHI